MKLSLPFKISLIIHVILLVTLLLLNPLKPIKSSGKIVLSIQSRPVQDVENLEQRDIIESMDAPEEKQTEQIEELIEPYNELPEEIIESTVPEDITEEIIEENIDPPEEEILIEAEIKPTKELEVEYADSYRLDYFEEDLLSAENLLLEDLDSGETSFDNNTLTYDEFDILWDDKRERKIIYIPQFDPPLDSIIDLNLIQNVSISFSVSAKGYIVNSRVVEPGSGDLILDNWFLEQVSTVIFEKVDDDFGEQKGVFTFFFDSGGGL